MFLPTRSALVKYLPYPRCTITLPSKELRVVVKFPVKLRKYDIRSQMWVVPTDRPVSVAVRLGEQCAIGAWFCIKCKDWLAKSQRWGVCIRGPTAVFFFFPEKMKSARENGFWHCFWFFSREEFFFSPTFFWISLGQSKVFSGTFSYFFSGWLFFFSGRNLRFFSGSFFFSRAEFFQRALNFQRVKCRFKGDFWRTPTGSELCYRRDFANMERVSATGKMIISI